MCAGVYLHLKVVGVGIIVDLRRLDKIHTYIHIQQSAWYIDNTYLIPLDPKYIKMILTSYGLAVREEARPIIVRSASRGSRLNLSGVAE